MLERYILNEHGEPEKPMSDQHWSWWMLNADRTVEKETIGDSMVSTVFLGIDHNWSGQGPPVLWETMVFGGILDMEQDRCSGSREQAEAMHAKMVAKVNQKILNSNE